MSIESPMIGEIITLGRYPYEENGDVQPIEWQVVEVEDERVLVLARQILATRPYAMQGVPTYWEQSDLRRWLREDFLREAFTEAEIERICGQAEPEATDMSRFLWELAGMYDTTAGLQDRVFVPLSEDLGRWFGADAQDLFYHAAIAQPTPWAVAQGAEANGCWWLRDSMSQMPMASICSPCGSVGASMLREGNLQGVRPAMWLRR